METVKIKSQHDLYYGEDTTKLSDVEKMALFAIESREATGLLHGAIRAILHDKDAVAILNKLRDELIDDMENDPLSWAAANKTLFLYRRNNVQ